MNMKNLIINNCKNVIGWYFINGEFIKSGCITSIVDKKSIKDILKILNSLEDNNWYYDNQLFKNFKNINDILHINDILDMLNKDIDDYHIIDNPYNKTKTQTL